MWQRARFSCSIPPPNIRLPPTAAGAMMGRRGWRDTLDGLN